MEGRHIIIFKSAFLCYASEKEIAITVFGGTGVALYSSLTYSLLTI